MIPQRDRGFRRNLRIGHVQSETPVTLLRNDRSRSTGIVGHVRPETSVTLVRNTHNTFALVSTVTAMLACYGTIAAIGLMAALGIAISVNAGVQAGVITLFAILAAVIIVVNGVQKRYLGPPLLALTGTGIICWVMWGRYNWMLELVGFLALLGAAYWDWRRHRRL